VPKEHQQFFIDNETNIYKLSYTGVDYNG